MHAIAQEHHEQISLGVDPQRRAGVTAMTERARRQPPAAQARVLAARVEAGGAQDPARELRLGQRGHALRAQHARAVELAARQQHARVAREIGRGRKHARVAGDAAEPVRARIVDAAPDQLRSRRAQLADLGRRDARLPARRRRVARVAHGERAEQRALRERLEWLLAHPPHQLAEPDVTHVAVQEALAGHVDRLDRECARHVRAWISGVVGQRVDVRQPRGVQQQLAHGDRARARAVQLGQVAAYATVERERTALDQLRDRGAGRHRLGQRGQVEHRVLGHRELGGYPRALAVRLDRVHAIVASDRDHASRQLARCDRVRDQRVDA